jgi:hypothetical protein
VKYKEYFKLTWLGLNNTLGVLVNLILLSEQQKLPYMASDEKLDDFQ